MILLAREDPHDPTLKFCIIGEHWTREWKLKQHYCDMHWREYRRKQKQVARHKHVLRERQGNVCPICQRPLDMFKESSIHVDHDHTEAFLIRGLLCINCNSILGHARDDIAVLQRALDYLMHMKPQSLDDILSEGQLTQADYENLF